MYLRRNRGQRQEPCDIQLVYQPDHRAMLAALRVVLGLPRVPSPLEKAAHDPAPEA